MSLFSSLSSRRTSVRSVLGLLGVATVLAACSKPAPPEEPVRAVKVLTVGLTSFDSGLEYAGEVKARVESRLGLRVAGKITQRTVEVGQRVKAGQVLARLDPRDYQLATDAGRAQVVAATTQRDLAAADLARYKALKDQNFISGAELERRDAALKSAQAQLDQAKAQASAQGNQARYTHLVADVAGVITAVDAEAGQVVAAGTPVVRIAQDGPRDVVFAVPEDKVGLIKPGSAVQILPWGTGATIQGAVREVAASADPVTRTFIVKVGLPAQDALALGSTVTVKPEALGRAGVQAIKLPTSALRQDGSATAVWLLDPATLTVRLQPIRIGTADGNEVVVTEGLQPGQQVVTAGVHVLSPGQKVTIYKEKYAQAPVEQAQAAIKSVATPSLPSAASAPRTP